jgi:hypothetical protein
MLNVMKHMEDQTPAFLAKFGYPQGDGDKFLSFHSLLQVEDQYWELENSLRKAARSGDIEAAVQLGKFLISCGKRQEGLRLLTATGNCRKARKVLLEYFLHQRELSAEELTLRRQFFLRWRLDGNPQDADDARYYMALICLREGRTAVAAAMVPRDAPSDRWKELTPLIRPKNPQA